MNMKATEGEKKCVCGQSHGQKPKSLETLRTYLNGLFPDVPPEVS